MFVRVLEELKKRRRVLSGPCTDLGTFIIPETQKIIIIKKDFAFFLKNPKYLKTFIILFF